MMRSRSGNRRAHASAFIASREGNRRHRSQPIASRPVVTASRRPRPVLWAKQAQPAVPKQVAEKLAAEWKREASWEQVAREPAAFVLTLSRELRRAPFLFPAPLPREVSPNREPEQGSRASPAEDQAFSSAAAPSTLPAQSCFVQTARRPVRRRVSPVRCPRAFYRCGPVP